IGVTRKLRRQVIGQPALLLQPRVEIIHPLRKLLRIDAAQADVEVIALAEAPTVAQQVVAEEEFRRMRRNAAGSFLVGAEFDLHLLGRDRRTALDRLAQEPRNGTK